MTGCLEQGEGVSDSAGGLPRLVLLIEDNMIIALDTEEILRELGVAQVTTCGSVEQALRAIAQEQPDFAVLDFNLGEETAEPVARELAQRGVPFVLATGYSADEIDCDGLVPQALLRKPYEKAEIARALARAGGG